jgi:hypothetical protein
MSDAVEFDARTLNESLLTMVIGVGKLVEIFGYVTAEILDEFRYGVLCLSRR